MLKKVCGKAVRVQGRRKVVFREAGGGGGEAVLVEA